MQPLLKPGPKDNKYQLTRDYKLVVRGINIVIPRYFMYDGASIPTLAWQFTFSPFHPDVILPSLVHDWMYYNHQEERETTDVSFLIYTEKATRTILRPPQCGVLSALEVNYTGKTTKLTPKCC